MYCPKCGAEVESYTTYCPNCRENLRDSTSPNKNENTKPLRPNNYLAFAIIATIFCCLPLGIVSIVKAASVNSRYDMGLYDEALKASNSAKKWAMWSAIAWAILFVLYVICIMIFGVAMFSVIDQELYY